MKTPTLTLFLLALAGPGAFAEMRTWTSAADPSKTFEAEFRSLDGDIVQLVTKDGRVLPVKVEILSDADREFIKAQAEAAPEPPARVEPLSREVLEELEDAPVPKAVGKKLVTVGGRRTRRLDVDPAKYYIVYHGASFSNPCFDAAPGLGKKYTELVASNPLVEMIYVAHDKEEEQMIEMLKEFAAPIPALKFGELEKLDELKKHLPERVTVPIYQLLDAQGELVASGEGVFEKIAELK